ncbi:DNA polymerase IV [Candidatus Fermentibacteria bacterium]|nr:DNA polymerase IV [Candidatus Fermentibacteria bacterium]
MHDDLSAKRARVVVHLDMDAFFASVEQRDMPCLKGRPVIVGGEREGRGIVSAASYEARRFGVHSAMSMKEARRLCPHGVFLTGNWSKYVQASLEVFATCQRFAPRLEVVSVDECTMWFHQTWAAVVEHGRTLSEAITSTHGLSCSIGIAPNRLLAKLGSSMDKPGGFTVLHPLMMPGAILPLKASSLWGIGKKTSCLLEQHGIVTIGDLLRNDPVRLRRICGDRMARLLDDLKGALDGEQGPIKERSLGHEYTFGHDVRIGPEFWAVVTVLCDRVSRRLRQDRLQASRVQTRLRWSSFETHTRQTSAREDLHDPSTLRFIATRLLKGMIQRDRRVRLVGVTAAGLRRDVEVTLEDQLFPDTVVRKRLVSAMDRIWDRFGEESLSRGSALL